MRRSPRDVTAAAIIALIVVVAAIAFVSGSLLVLISHGVLTILGAAIGAWVSYELRR